jgi:hypothetical protein
MRAPKLVPGQKFNRLTVISYISRKEGYLCLCDCGKQTKATSWELKTDKRKSCGCLAKEIRAIRLSKPNFESFKNEIYKNYQRSTKHRNIYFELSKEEFFKLLDGNCKYCGLPPSSEWYGAKRTILDYSAFRYNGIDRVDNAKGYTVENCVPCCKVCNNSKACLTVEEWLSWVDRIHDFQNLCNPRTK